MSEEMSVEELDALCEDFIKKKEYEKKAKARMSEISAETKEAQSKVIAALEKFGKKMNEGSFGKVSVVQKEYYKIIDKEAALQWLKDRGEFDDLASVNANTFSSHVKGLVAEAHDKKDYTWLPPGVEDATSDYTYLKVTKG